MSAPPPGLHPQLARDCYTIGHFELCTLLLMKDANYPWFILVPNRENIREIFQLSMDDQLQLCRESAVLAAVIDTAFEADKINIAALGNVVPQLHLHHIVRFRDDPAWPAPVWGAVAPRPYSEDEKARLTAAVLAGLDEQSGLPFHADPAEAADGRR